MRRSLQPVIAIGLPLLAACTATNAVGGGTSGSGTEGSADTQTAIEQSPECADYLECAALLVPNELGGLVDTYGPLGSCWASDAVLAQTCTSACGTNLAGLQDTFGTNACESESDSQSADVSDGASDGPLVIDLGAVPCVQFGVHELADFIVASDGNGITCEVTAGDGAGRLPDGMSISNACEFEGEIAQERLGGWAAIVRVLQSGTEVFVPFCAVRTETELDYDVVIEPSPLMPVTFAADQALALPRSMPTYDIASPPDACGQSCSWRYNFNAAASPFDEQSIALCDAMTLEDDAGDGIGLRHGLCATGPAVDAQFEARPWVLSLDVDYCFVPTAGGCERPAEVDDAFSAFAVIMSPV